MLVSFAGIVYRSAYRSRNVDILPKQLQNTITSANVRKPKTREDALNARMTQHIKTAKGSYKIEIASRSTSGW